MRPFFCLGGFSWLRIWGRVWFFWVLGLAAKSVNVLGSGSVDGSVSSESLAVEGKVDGSVNTNDLSIAATGQLKADVVYQSIATAKGAKVEGTLKTK